MSEVLLPFAVREALTPRERARGLIGRVSLDPQEGVWISPCRQVHTFGMKFPIDVAFLGADDEVIHTIVAMRPRRVSKVIFGATGALELTAGTLGECEVRLGDVLRWQPAS